MKCRECKYIEARGANEYCTYHDAYVGWHGCEYGEPKPQTNADRIRAMTDEELAELFQNLCCPYSLGGKVDCNIENRGCGNCWLSWAEYIEREAAIDCLHFVCVPQCRKYAQEEIKKIPAADVAPVRHGRWKFKEDKAWVGNGKYWCSVCRYGFASGAYHEVDDFKFCPMCGAKMGGEE